MNTKRVPQFAACLVVLTLVSASFAVAQERSKGATRRPGSQDRGRQPHVELYNPAIGSYCPVSYQTDGKPVRGDSKYQSQYQGFTYYFADAEKKAMFDKDPQKYAPHLGGLCTVALGGPYGNRFVGDPTVFNIIDGKLYLCSSTRAKRSLDKRPEYYAKRAEELFNKPALNGYCPVAYQMAGKEVRGESRFLVPYRFYTYALSSEKAAKEFAKNPEKFVPAFDGYCAEGISGGDKYPADPTVFAVVDGKTYLFYDQSAKESCLNVSPNCLGDAKQRWEQMERELYHAPGGR